MNLLVVRHAIAEDPTTWTGRDDTAADSAVAPDSLTTTA